MKSEVAENFLQTEEGARAFARAIRQEELLKEMAAALARKDGVEPRVEHLLSALNAMADAIDRARDEHAATTQTDDETESVPTGVASEDVDD